MEHDEAVVAAARAAHEANRVLCEALGQSHYGSWEECPQEIRDSVLSGVEEVRKHPGRTPRESHQAWADWKRAQGWKAGPEKSVERKEHPNLVPFEELPVAEQSKDSIFLAVTRAVLSAHGELRHADDPAFEFYEGTVDGLPTGGGWAPIAPLGKPNHYRWRRLSR